MDHCHNGPINQSINQGSHNFLFQDSSDDSSSTMVEGEEEEEDPFGPTPPEEEEKEEEDDDARPAKRARTVYKTR